MVAGLICLAKDGLYLLADRYYLNNKPLLNIDHEFSTSSNTYIVFNDEAFNPMHASIMYRYQKGEVTGKLAYYWITSRCFSDTKEL